MPDPTPPPATPAATPAAAPPAAAPPVDPWTSRMLGDLGKVLDNGELKDAIVPAAEGQPQTVRHEFTSMGEHARFKAEREEAEKAKALPADPAAPAPGATPAPAAAPTPAPAPTPPPVNRPITVEKTKPLEDVIEGVVRRIQSTAEPAKPPAAPAPPADPDAQYIAGLDDVQREEVELARFAAKEMPDKYGKMPQQMVAYLRKVDAYIDAKKKEDPSWDHQADEDYASFLEDNRPTYSGADRRRIERALITAETTEKVRAEMRPQFEATERRARAQEIKPEVDQAVKSYAGEVLTRLASDDKSPLAAVSAAAKTSGWDGAKEIDPVAASVVKLYSDQAVALGREYLEVATEVKAPAVFDPKRPPTDPVNQSAVRQAQLFGFIDQQEAIFAAEGGQMRVVNGRSFLPRSEFAALPQTQQAKHWTLSHTDVLEMISNSAEQQAKNAYASETARLASLGYSRVPKTPPPKPAETPAPVPAPAAAGAGSPRAVVSSAPGAATPTPTPQAPGLMSPEEFKRYMQGGAGSWA